jgi:hypoxanthine phosphoribosyltransferase
MGETLTRLFPQEQIGAAVRRLAAELHLDYADRSPVVVGVLKAAFIFLADLLRHMKTPIRDIELVRLSSYGMGVPHPW